MDYKNVVANAITNSFFQEISEYSTKQRTYIKEQEESYTDNDKSDFPIFTVIASVSNTTVSESKSLFVIFALPHF